MLQFNMEYVQFCTELAIKALKKENDKVERALS